MHNDLNQLGQTNERFVFIDGLRGVACVMVVVHHLLFGLWSSGVLPEQGRLLERIGDFGQVGVEIFFVISGFVIAHSLRAFDGTFAAAARFAVRRQFRLDPPYWVAIGCATAILVAEKLITPSTSEPFPTFTAYLANLFYLHRITGQPEIVNVSWTLCIEVQFYVLFVTLLLLSTHLGGRAAQHVMTGLAVASAVASMWIGSQHPVQAWALPYWHYFIGGVLAYWTWKRRIAPYWLTILATVALVRFAYAPNVYVGAGWITVVLVSLVAHRGRLTSWTLGTTLQYLGLTSYSLYLIHRPIIVVIMWAAAKLDLHTWPVILILSLTTFAVCVAVAHLLWKWVERPAMQLAKWPPKRRKPLEVPGQLQPPLPA